MIRVYAAASSEDLAQLAAGAAIRCAVVQAESTDEEHEFEALLEASKPGLVVVTAEVDAADAPIRLEDVAAFHFDSDGSGHLSWFARQELAAVIELLRSAQTEQ